MNKQILELAEKCNGERTFFDGELLSITFAVANLEKFAKLLLAQQSDRIAELDSLQKASIDHLVRGLTAERDELKADKARLLGAIKHIRKNSNIHENDYNALTELIAEMEGKS